MPLSRRLTIVAIFLAPVSLLCSCFLVPAKAVQPRSAPEPVSNPVGRPGNNFRWEGVGSCAASSCHGSLDKPETPRLDNAVTVWTLKDPHARSYFTLRTENSRKMLAALRQLPSVAAAKPETDPLCLKCHAMGVSEEWRGSKFDPTEGVGCENCHGAAGKWKTMHDLPSWKLLTDSEKTSFGMRPLRNPVVRADVCATCHQGSPDREVTHDLIAAGHPALYLDITPQNYRLPHHWDKAIDRQQPDFAARLWVSGQIMGVRMSMENLASTAKNADKPWPEFSEYDCLSCHHSARRNTLGQVEGVPLGLPAYMAWHQPVTRLLADAGRFADPALSPLLDKLNAEMNKPLPDRQVVAAVTADVKVRLDEMLWKLEGTTYERKEVLALMRTIIEGSAKHSEARWYTGTQIAIALTALNRTRLDFEPGTPRSEINDVLRAFRQAFPPPLASQWEKLSKKPQSMTPFLMPLVDLLK